MSEELRERVAEALWQRTNRGGTFNLAWSVNDLADAALTAVAAHLKDRRGLAVGAAIKVLDDHGTGHAGIGAALTAAYAALGLPVPASQHQEERG